MNIKHNNNNNLSLYLLINKKLINFERQLINKYLKLILQFLEDKKNQYKEQNKEKKLD